LCADRITRVQSSLVVTVLEPAAALLRGAVSEGLRHDIALRLPLQIVIADSSGGTERLVDIADVEDTFLLRGARPNSGVAVGLQLKTNGKSVRRRPVRR